MKFETWTWWEILLWAYSTLYMLLFASVYLYYSLVPFTVVRPTSTTVDVILFIFILPVLIFLVAEGVRHLPREKSGK